MLLINNENNIFKQERDLDKNKTYYKKLLT